MGLPPAFSTANGKIAFGYKELLQLVILALGIGSAWAGLHAKTGELSKADEVLETKVAWVKSETEANLRAVETQVDADHDVLKQVQSDMEHVRDDVQQIKTEQVKAREGLQRQEVATAQILAEIQALKPKVR